MTSEGLRVKIDVTCPRYDSFKGDFLPEHRRKTNKQNLLSVNGRTR